MVLSLFGLDLDSQAQAEVSALNSGRDDFKNWDLGDMFRSAVTGVSRESVLEEASKILTEKINDQSSDKVGSILDSTAGTSIGFTEDSLGIQPGESLSQYNARLGRGTRLGTAVQEAIATTPGFDASTVTSASSPTSVLQTARTITDKKAADKKQEADERQDELDKRYYDSIKDRNEQQKVANQQADRAQSFREHEARENRKERAHREKMARLERQDERADRKSELLMNREMKMLDRQYMRERDERADARADKAKKQQMIMQMMKGLSNMGAAFAL